MAELHSARLNLRRFRASDLASLIRLESDPEVMRFTSMRVPCPPEKTRERLDSLLGKEAERHPLGVWAAEERDAGAFVGWFMLLKTDLALPELGFMLVREQWGKGYATEAALALVDHALGTLKLSGIAARADRENAPSHRVLEKLGFRSAGTRCGPDKVLGVETETCVFELRR